ncbi:oxidoreductase [Diaporthe helianthi]|uniref:Oxidoreductase n=1 Tax=Diaporthe helianthi TaxID=158607 RepID=A0A2P5HFI5_DIAHE|nr:oxidoreductase [Diaporthe helianthi]
MSSQESVLITGCSDGGLGAALATTFHERGYLVFATSRSLKTMTNASNIAGVRVLQLHITSETDRQAAKTAVSKETAGSLSYLPTSGGRQLRHPQPLHAAA